MTASPSPADRAATLLAPIDPDARMDAYYYSFDPTGIGIIDEILSQVAIAGKMYHSTEWWNDDEDGTPTHQERIQKAAQDATDAVRTLIIDLVAAAKRAKRMPSPFGWDALQIELEVVEEQLAEALAAVERAEADADRLAGLIAPTHKDYATGCVKCRALRLHDEAVAQR